MSQHTSRVQREVAAVLAVAGKCCSPHTHGHRTCCAHRTCVWSTSLRKRLHTDGFRGPAARPPVRGVWPRRAFSHRSATHLFHNIRNALAGADTVLYRPVKRSGARWLRTQTALCMCTSWLLSRPASLIGRPYTDWTRTLHTSTRNSTHTCHLRHDCVSLTVTITVFQYTCGPPSIKGRH